MKTKQITQDVAFNSSKMIQKNINVGIRKRDHLVQIHVWEFGAKFGNW